MTGARRSANLLNGSKTPPSMEMLMRIAMIGAGNVGSALGRAWLRSGEDVVFGVPNPADLKSVAPRGAAAHSAGSGSRC